MMTLEEAIKLLTNMKMGLEPYATLTDSSRDVYEALVLAIQALQDTPTCELKTENGITYPAALDRMTFTHELTPDERFNINQAFLLGYRSGLDDRPTTPWVNLGLSSNRGPLPFGKCTKCNSVVYVDPAHCKYCSECGAKMSAPVE